MVTCAKGVRKRCEGGAKGVRIGFVPLFVPITVSCANGSRNWCKGGAKGGAKGCAKEYAYL